MRPAAPGCSCTKAPTPYALENGMAASSCPQLTVCNRVLYIGWLSTHHLVHEMLRHGMLIHQQSALLAESSLEGQDVYRTPWAPALNTGVRPSQAEHHLANTRPHRVVRLRDGRRWGAANAVCSGGQHRPGPRLGWLQQEVRLLAQHLPRDVTKEVR